MAPFFTYTRLYIKKAIDVSFVLKKIIYHSLTPKIFTIMKYFVPVHEQKSNFHFANSNCYDDILYHDFSKFCLRLVFIPTNNFPTRKKCGMDSIFLFSSSLVIFLYFFVVYINIYTNNYKIDLSFLDKIVEKQKRSCTEIFSPN